MQFSEDALKFINLGINSEIAAYVFYKHAGAIVTERGLQDTLHKLANDEKGHFLTLEDLYDRNVRSEMWAPYKDILSKEGLPDIDELVQECLLYTSDAADDLLCVDLGGRRIIKKKKK